MFRIKGLYAYVFRLSVFTLKCVSDNYVSLECV
jgi:hypothetical protein